MPLRHASATEIIESLQLRPLPDEGGFFREAYRDTSLSTYYYLITNDNFSALHSMTGTHLWNFCAGDPASMIIISPEGELTKRTLGHNLRADHSLQAVVTANFLQGTRLLPGGIWALFSCTILPPFEPTQFKYGQRTEMIQKYPHLFDIISRYSNS
jgi:predicted cupin superfamily sugar epimerase